MLAGGFNLSSCHPGLAAAATAAAGSRAVARCVDRDRGRNGWPPSAGL